MPIRTRPPHRLGRRRPIPRATDLPIGGVLLPGTAEPAGRRRRGRRPARRRRRRLGNNGAGPSRARGRRGPTRWVRRGAYPRRTCAAQTSPPTELRSAMPHREPTQPALRQADCDKPTICMALPTTCRPPLTAFCTDAPLLLAAFLLLLAASCWPLLAGNQPTTERSSGRLPPTRPFPSTCCLPLAT